MGELNDPGGGDNLAVGWQLPSGGYERPIPGSRLSPWSGAPDPAPVITSTATTTAMENVLYAYTITVTGDPTPTVSVSGEPSWLLLAGNVLSGTPGASDVGTTPVITVTAYNGVGPDATEQFQIVVSAFVGEVPVITSTAPTSAVANSPYTYTVTATGLPAPTFTVTGLPTWLTSSTDTISGTPGTLECRPDGDDHGDADGWTRDDGSGRPGRRSR